MLIYIRHADDEYPDATHRYDHRITVRGARRARKLAKYLVRKYGAPDIIYRTPFVRGRETIEAMRPEFPNKPDVYIDRRLSRRFSRSEQADPSIFSETHEHRPPIREDRAGFHARVCRQRRAMIDAGYVDSDTIVWCITHAIVYKNIAAKFGVPVPDRVPFLDHFPAPLGRLPSHGIHDIEDRRGGDHHFRLRQAPPAENRRVRQYEERPEEHKNPHADGYRGRADGHHGRADGYRGDRHHGDRHHDDRHHGDRHHGDRHHGDRHHGGHHAGCHRTGAELRGGARR